MRLTSTTSDSIGAWDKSNKTGDAQTFDLTLSLEDLYTNKSQSQRIFFKIYEGDDERWVTIKWIEIQLPACQGLEAPAEAIAAGGEFIMDADGECQWSGAWTSRMENGEPAQTSDTDGAKSSIDSTTIGLAAGALVIIILLTLVFLRKGSAGGDDTIKDFAASSAGYGNAQLDATEQYVQQLIAQGYPEDTARTYAQQYAAQAAGAAAPVAAAAAPAVDDAVYQQYYQQFVGQGYDEATAATYAQQYAVQYAQSQQ